MKVQLIGSGGRESALAWKLARDGDELVAENPDLIVVGPEGPLAEGIADRPGPPVFGPSQRAAEIESSKAFSKDFMTRHGIPTARHASFRDYQGARDYLHRIDYAVVLKASGLAAGKGVLLPDSLEEAHDGLRRLMLAKEFGEAGSEVVIEERLSGREVSLMAFCDGERVAAMPAACDHKRLLDGDQGPNTGGMGAFAPDPRSTFSELESWTVQVLQPAVRGMAAEGRPFKGVLYAGLMLTAAGPRVLEFNCRFGDPETQVVVPLLESSLAEVMQACTEGALHQVELRWSQRTAACVVLTAAGYPGPPRQGDSISGLDLDVPDTLVFAAGARDGKTTGGRVLGVTGLGNNLAQALERAYARVARIHFEGCHYRLDIGRLA